MNVGELIEHLKQYDADSPVTIDGVTLGLGYDLKVSEIHKFSNEEAVRLIPGEEYEEWLEW